MAKPKTPFFSLEAHGSVGGNVTAQRLAHVNILRQKPKPAYRRTLPQTYQRWLYEDYAYLWTQQSAATQAQYRSAGVRWHLTGFQFWMKVMLSTMPDIAAWWRLDEKGGAVCHDSSPNANNGTFVGPIPNPAWINGGQLFDGLNDHILFTTTPSLNVTGDQTLELLLNLTFNTKHQTFFSKGSIATDWISIIVLNNARIHFHTAIAGIQLSTWTALGAFPWSTTVHLLFTLSGAVATIYLNGQDITLFHGAHIETSPTALPTLIGVRDDWLWWTKGVIDNFIYYNRVLDQTEIQRHSLRRYPP